MRIIKTSDRQRYGDLRKPWQIGKDKMVKQWGG